MMEIKKDWVIVNGNGDVVKVIYNEPEHIAEWCFAELVHKGTGLKVNVAEKPLESVAIGLSKIIKDDNYKSLAYAIEGMGGK